MQIESYTTPGDPNEEFYGGIVVHRFASYETQKNFTIIVRPDGVPEVKYMYTKVNCTLVDSFAKY